MFSTFLMNLLRLFAWLALLAAIFIPLERQWARRRQKVFRGGFRTDLVYYFLSGVMPDILGIIPLTILAVIVHRIEPTGFYEWTAHLPMGVRLALALLVGEIGAYWGHRWSHEIPLLWRFHAIHHSSEHMDWLVSSRAHPVDKLVMRMAALVPMFLLGLAQPTGDQLDLVPAIVAVSSNAWGFLIHANVNWRLGWMESVLSSPAFHHWHHTNDDAIYLNKNYAPMLPWIDRCFGTLYLPDKFPDHYGTDTPVPDDLSDQLLQPLMGEFADCPSKKLRSI